MMLRRWLTTITLLLSVLAMGSALHTPDILTPPSSSPTTLVEAAAPPMFTAALAFKRPR